MELVQGKPLSSLVRHANKVGQPLNQKLAAMIVAHAAHGLHHAHGMCDASGQKLGLVHRDVSPQNILVSFEGHVKVIDFGIARARGRITATTTGGMKGKVGYMSPEQARGEPVDRRTDVFALGVVLWESVCARRLFFKDTDFATMRAIVYDPIPRPSMVVKVAPALERIIMKALDREPPLRYQSAQEMAVDLERFVVQWGGSTTADLGRQMQSTFAQDMAQWQKTVRLALAMQDVPTPSTMEEIHISATGKSKAQILAPSIIGQSMAVPSPPLVPTPAPKTSRWLLVSVVGGLVAVAALVTFVMVMLARRPVSYPPSTTEMRRQARKPSIELTSIPRPEPLPPAPAVAPQAEFETENRAVSQRPRRAERAPLGGRRPNPFEAPESNLKPAPPSSLPARRPNPFE
jgi:serine/threonine-protein kinase